MAESLVRRADRLASAYSKIQKGECPAWGLETGDGQLSVIIEWT